MELKPFEHHPFKILLNRARGTGVPLLFALVLVSLWCVAAVVGAGHCYAAGTESASIPYCPPLPPELAAYIFAATGMICLGLLGLLLSSPFFWPTGAARCHLEYQQAFLTHVRDLHREARRNRDPQLCQGLNALLSQAEPPLGARRLCRLVRAHNRMVETLSLARQQEANTLLYQNIRHEAGLDKEGE